MEDIIREQLQRNIGEIRQRMDAAALAAGRNPADIRLCAASKLHDADTVRLAAELNIDIFGENHVQELVAKKAAGAYLEKPLHFIGHLQTNKVKQVVGAVELIQSVDSERLLSAIEKQADKCGIVQDILLEINIGGEESKGGFPPQDLAQILPKISEFSNIRVIGLMAIPPISQKNGDNLKYFQKMYNISVDIIEKKYDNVMVECMSMGMSDDYADAIACGSTMIRIGTAIFGARDYAKLHQT